MLFPPFQHNYFSLWTWSQHTCSLLFVKSSLFPWVRVCAYLWLAVGQATDTHTRTPMLSEDNLGELVLTFHLVLKQGINSVYGNVYSRLADPWTSRWFFSLHFPFHYRRAGITDAFYHIQLFIRIPGIEHRLSHLQSKHVYWLSHLSRPVSTFLGQCFHCPIYIYICCSNT